MENDSILFEIYTDGSFNPENKTGTWAAIIISNGNKTILTGIEQDTTHNRMEILAAIRSIEYINDTIKFNVKINIYTDSQYLSELPYRIEKLQMTGYKTKKDRLIRNEDLIRSLAVFIENKNINFIKVKAHEKKTEKINYNREADKLARKLLRNQK